MVHPETARPYFERETRFGMRLAFQWTPAKRWPGPCAAGPYCLRLIGEDGCPLCSPAPKFEGIAFASEGDMQRWVDGRSERDGHLHRREWQEFDSWDEAETWVGGA